MDLVERVKGILTQPKAEWRVIEREGDDLASLFKNYVAVLAAIPAICGFVGLALVGVSLPAVGTVRMGIGAALGAAVLGYALSFVKVYVMAYVIDALAPTFGGQKDFLNALRTAVYSYTPAWLVGVFLLIPALGFLGILALYGLYLLWTGLPTMMKVAEDRALGYAGGVVVVAIILGLVLGLIESAFLRM